MERFKFLPKNRINDLPKTSGVYSFKNGAELTYIGKAVNIRDRVKNHFNQPSYRDNLFINKVNKIGYFETNSEIEALILEANLIKKYQPKFNVVWRDDKNYFYVAVAKNEQKIPYVFITHQPSFAKGYGEAKKNYEKTEYIGPFVEGTALKKTLRFLKKAFPYYTVKKHSKNKCTYCHLGLCPGPDPDVVEYKKNIKKLVLILQGKRNTALNSLKKEMKQLAKDKQFEKAGKIRDRIYALTQIMSHTHVIEAGKSFFMPETATTLTKIIGTESPISKIECYDVSNIQGKQATGSIIVFINGSPDKSQYKKFRIRIENTPNDIAMLKETLQRRFEHPEWKLPEIILIDGGKAQLNVAISAKNEKAETKHIKVVSIAKGRQELFIENKKLPIPLKDLPQDIYNLIKSLDDEAHRFAITYHKKLRQKNLFQ